MPRNTAVFSPTFHGEGIVRSDDITKDPRYGHNDPYYGKPKGHLPVVSYLAVPVKSRSGEVLGGLFFGHEEAAVFSERHEHLVVGIAGWAGVAMDNARLFESQRKAVAQAEEANRAKSDFLAKMSHDLRTPLNAIGGYAELISMSIHGPVTDEQQSALARIQRAQQHLLTLINDILSFAKLEAGQVRIEPARIGVRPLMEELSTLITPQAAAGGLELHIDPGAEGLTVNADRARVVQILVNLLSNAVKFTEKGRIELKAQETDDEVHFVVSDTGSGIAADRLPTIFDPFVQFRNGASDEKAGVGLGLAISRELARLMNGGLSVVSEEGRGSIFTLQLPRGEIEHT
jgi:signal transduction histidine kinase